jgi:hypothetical protein
VLVDVKFHPIEGKEICEVIVRPSSKPIVLCDGDKEEFYVRGGKSTEVYPASAMIDYRQKFKTT